MVDVATVASLVMGTVAIVVSSVTVGLAVRHTKMLRSTTRLVDSMHRAQDEGTDVKRQALAQRQQEQQYRQFRDVAKAIGWFVEQYWEDVEGEEDYEEY